MFSSRLFQFFSHYTSSLLLFFLFFLAFPELSEPGSPCRYNEHNCLSGDQCIPRSYQCDGEFDCQDKSDEIGCGNDFVCVAFS